MLLCPIIHYFGGRVESHYLRHNLSELKKKTYFYVGQMIALSLEHGGPAPTFFC